MQVDDNDYYRIRIFAISLRSQMEPTKDVDV